jgi:O-antigen/teichoic acid export membrane protein
MKDLAILISSRFLTGAVGLVLFVLLKDKIPTEEYALFSVTWATLTLISTVGGGVLSGLLLKNGFKAKGPYAQVVLAYTVLFALVLSVVVLLFASYQDGLGISVWTFLAFLWSHLLCSVALVHDQLNQRFFRMGLLELSRNLLPVVVLFAWSQLNLDTAIWLFTIGQLPGVFLFLSLVFWSGQQHAAISWKHYFQSSFSSDLKFGLSFSAFNAIVQAVFTKDRQLIMEVPVAQTAANTAYTADQMTRVSNGVLFPLNTKVSSQLGKRVREQAFDRFYKELNIYAFYTLILGSSLTLLGYLVVKAFNSHAIIKDLDALATWQYGVANTIYLACLIYQKRFDYSKWKALPAILMLFSAGAAWLAQTIVFQGNPFWVSYFFQTAICYGICLFVAVKVIPKRYLNLFNA